MPHEIVARSSSPNAWILPANPGQPVMGPFKTADGRDIYGLVADGEIAGLGFVPTFRHARGSVFGDLLWTTCAIKVASANFIAALDGYTGWRCFGGSSQNRVGLVRCPGEEAGEVSRRGVAG